MHVYPMHSRRMKLADWMRAKALTDAAFAEMVGRDRTTVSRWRTEKTRPDWPALAAIERATNGAVTARDFLQPLRAAE